MAAKQLRKIVSYNNKLFKYPGYLSYYQSYSVKCPQKIKKESKITHLLPHQVGEVKVSVRVNGNHITGSPYSVAASHDYTSLSKPSKIVSHDDRVGKLWGIGCSRNGKWAVTDGQCVYLYDGEDQLVRTIGSSISSQYDPRGVAFDDKDHLYITDSCGVQKFTFDGECLLQFDGYALRHLSFFTPTGITVHNDKVYVIHRSHDIHEMTSSYITVFFTDGVFHQAFGVRQLSNPHDVVVTSNDELLVVDSSCHCIYRFTLDGDYIDKFGNHGDELCYPMSSIAIDQNDFVFVTGLNGQVVIFDKYGNLVHKFGSSGDGNGEFSAPRGIAVNQNSDIYISDHGNKRVQIFSNY